MRSEIPQPCSGPRASVLRMRRSRVPCGSSIRCCARSEIRSGIRSPYTSTCTSTGAYTDSLVEVQGEKRRGGIFVKVAGLASLFAGGRNGGGFLGAGVAGDGGDDLAAVEASIFDENFTGVQAAEQNAGQINSGDIAFERFEIAIRLARFGIEADSETLQEREIGMIAGHGKNSKGRQVLNVTAVLDNHGVGLEADNTRLKERANFAGANAIFDVGAHPVFQGLAQFGAAMHESDFGAGAK